MSVFADVQVLFLLFTFYVDNVRIYEVKHTESSLYQLFCLLLGSYIALENSLSRSNEHLMVLGWFYLLQCTLYLVVNRIT